MSNPRLLTVTYMDERPVKTTKVGMGALVAVERRWPQGAPMLEALLFSAWIALGNSFDDEEGFNAFCLEVENVETGKAESRDPSPPVATDAS